MGEPRAMRKVADALLDPKLSHMMLPFASGEGNNSDNGDTARAIEDNTGSEDLSSSSSSSTAATSPALSARQQAAVLYSLAGDQGDSESLLQLGWMLYYGEQGSIDLDLLLVDRSDLEIFISLSIRCGAQSNRSQGSLRDSPGARGAID